MEAETWDKRVGRSAGGQQSLQRQDEKVGELWEEGIHPSLLVHPNANMYHIEAHTETAVCTFAYEHRHTATYFVT